MRVRSGKACLTGALCLGGALGGSAMAADAPKPAAPTIGDVLDASGIAITGYVDVSYEHISGAGYFSSGTPDRVFDARHDSFTLHQAAFTIAKQPKEGFGAVVNITAGQDAEVIKSYPVYGGSNFDVTQAFVQYATGPLTVIAGKFVTLAGAELINPTTAYNFSRSILFGYAIPFTHTGVRASYGLNDQFSFSLGVVNGWDEVSDPNGQKTLEVGLSFTPVKPVSILVNGYFGNEPLGLSSSGPTAAQGQRALIDVVATWTATDKLTFVLNYDNGSQKDDTVNAAISKYKWDGLAGYVNYQLTDQWRVAVRGEYLNDKQGYRTGVTDPVTGAGQKWKEGTLTFAYAPTKNVELRFEGRYDKSNIATAFVKSVNAASSTPATDDKQNSLAIEALYKF